MSLEKRDPPVPERGDRGSSFQSLASVYVVTFLLSFLALFYTFSPLTNRNFYLSSPVLGQTSTMKFTTITTTLAAACTISATATSSAAASASSTLSASTTPGYYTDFSTLPNNNTFSFGRHYAVLNLDMINGLVAGVNSTAEGKAWIASTANWINVVHAQKPPPLSIFTRIYFTNAYRPEIGPSTPFAAAVAALGNATSDSPQSQLYPAFNTIPQDAVIQKSRYYAGVGNGLEEILAAQQIDTVILSGIRTSGVILSTAYNLFDLNYKVYIISNNTIETPSNAPGIDAAIKAGIIPKLPADVITVEQAIAALGRSGPAIY